MKTMKIILGLVFILFLYQGYTQQLPTVQDQNPNYMRSLKKYVNDTTNIILTQGTTLHEMYEAIDPMEDKRRWKKMRKEYRALKPLWRHQRRLERAKNTGYYGYGYYDNYNYRPYNYGYYDWNDNIFGIGLDLLDLGLLTYILFDD